GLSGSRSFVVADIPGIIEGAHKGKGLGFQFLQHVERTRVLAYLVPVDSPDAQAAYDRLRNEVRSYGASLHDKPHLVVLSKRDLLPASAPLPAIRAPSAKAVVALSSVARQGIEEFTNRVWGMVAAAREEQMAAGEPGQKDGL
ncbi:MAG TPA: GTPase, partial [Gemmatimonadales bacterium]|nr:GTPase [Gemmatimonadales bacterium]